MTGRYHMRSTALRARPLPRAAEVIECFPRKACVRFRSGIDHLRGGGIVRVSALAGGMLFEVRHATPKRPGIRRKPRDNY